MLQSKSENQAPNLKIIVTGGCGYIGSHTIVDLLDNGFNVVSIDNHLRSQPAVIERIYNITGKRIKNYAIDLCDKEASRRVFEIENDAIGLIHFAALKSVPESVKYPLLYYRNNLNSLINLLELAAEFDIDNFVFSSSCSVYGNVSRLPVTEQTDLGRPESPYAQTKQLSEQIIADFAETCSMRFVILRYFNPAGAHESGKLGEDSTDTITAIIPRITGTAIGKFDEVVVHGNDYDTRDGTCIRDYVHVMDIASAHSKALQELQSISNSTTPLIYNLGIGEGITVLETIEAFERVSGLKLNWKFGPRRAGDVAAIYANNDKAKAELGWVIKYNLDDMMKSAWLWEQELTRIREQAGAKQ